MTPGRILIESGARTGVTPWAWFSPDRAYRYVLGRTWDFDLPLTLYCGANPSTADAFNDDATVRKWTGFSMRMGHGGFIAVNKYGFRSRDPKVLQHVRDPIGDANDEAITDVIRSHKPAVVVACWGDAVRLAPGFRERTARMRELLPSPLCLGLTGKGNPKHPLMLSYSTPLVPWEADSQGATAAHP